MTSGQATHASPIFMQSPPNTLRNAATVADYLADREGLKGAPREIFLELLRDVFGFRATSGSRVVPILRMLTIAVLVAGPAAEWYHGSNEAAMWPWLAVAGVSALFSAAVARRQNRLVPIDYEHEWQAYWLLIRPAILRQRPGLLDTNRRDDSAPARKMTSGYRDTVRTMLHARDVEFWAPAGFGWALGSIAIVIWRISAGPGFWPFVLPLVGALIAPFVWGFVRQTVFQRLQRSAGE